MRPSLCGGRHDKVSNMAGEKRLSSGTSYWSLRGVLKAKNLSACTGGWCDEVRQVWQRNMIFKDTVAL